MPENGTYGSIGGRWPGDRPWCGGTHAPEGKPERLSPPTYRRRVTSGLPHRFDIGDRLGGPQSRPPVCYELCGGRLSGDLTGGSSGIRPRKAFFWSLVASRSRFGAGSTTATAFALLGW